jgi:eukaryotic-like serine/threonine-protein kinase
LSFVLSSSIILKRLMTLVLLSCIFAVSFLTVVYFVLRGRTVEVPNVVGKSKNDAVIELEDKGLRMHIRSRVQNNSIPFDAVIDQYPTPGTTVKSGQLVRVSLSGTPPPATQAK